MLVDGTTPHATTPCGNQKDRLSGSV